jgi:hypothetical protein
LGFDLVELLGAHGFLLHSFLSPVTNRRTDSDGGSLANRMRYPLEMAAAVRGVWPRRKAPAGAPTWAGRRAGLPASGDGALRIAITGVPDQRPAPRIAHAATVEPSAMVANAAVHPIAPPAPPNRSSAMPTATGPAKAAV